MKKLSIISHFYNHPGKVESQIARWKEIDRRLLDDVEFILVDDCSEDRPDVAAGHLDLKLYRIESDIDWNQAGARNLAFFNATGEWCLIFDIDQRLEPQALALLVDNLQNLDRDVMYYLKADGIYNDVDKVAADHHINTFLVCLDSFRNKAMYDEDFAGHYGYEDLLVPFVWEGNGGRRMLLNGPVFFTQDTSFRTENLNRDMQTNRALLTQKVAQGAQRPQNFLRFSWRRIVP